MNAARDVRPLARAVLSPVSGYGAGRAPAPDTRMLIDEFLPAYDVSDAVATTVSAGVPATWDALLQLDLIEVGRRRPAVAVLGALRGLPDVFGQLLNGKRPRPLPARLRLRDTIHLPMAKADGSCSRAPPIDTPDRQFWRLRHLPT